MGIGKTYTPDPTKRLFITSFEYGDVEPMANTMSGRGHASQTCANYGDPWLAQNGIGWWGG